MADSDGTGSSNGALVTGYQVLKDYGEVVATIPDPLADRAILSTSSLRGAKKVTVRTMSQSGTSIDSKPVRVPSNLSSNQRSPQSVNGSLLRTPAKHGSTGRRGYPSMLPEVPDYLSEASEVSELTDILEESDLMTSSRLPFNSGNVGSVAPSVYDYHQHLKEVRDPLLFSNQSLRHGIV